MELLVREDVYLLSILCWFGQVSYVDGKLFSIKHLKLPRKRVLFLYAAFIQIKRKLLHPYSAVS